MARIAHYDRLNVRKPIGRKVKHITNHLWIANWIKHNKPAIINYSNDEIDRMVKLYSHPIISTLELEVKNRVVNKNISRLVNRYRRIQESEVFEFKQIIRRNLPNVYDTMLQINEDENVRGFFWLVLIGIGLGGWAWWKNRNK